MDLKEKLAYWREFLQNQFNFTPIQLGILLLLIVAILSGSYLLYLRGKPSAPQVRQILEPQKNFSKPRQPLKKVVVHVAGAVRNAGVYELKEGSRVIDALKLAGGEREDANLDALNLAARLRDGEKIYLPSKEESLPEATSDPSSGGSSLTAEKISLNRATQEQLEELDGVGPVIAKRIISYRQKNGSFSRLEELQNVEGIGPKKFALIKDQVSLD